MNNIILALCSLINLATPEQLQLLGRLAGWKFEVGCLTLKGYGYDYAGDSDPVVQAVEQGILVSLAGTDLPARDVAEVIQQLKVSLSDAECICYGRRENVIVACDSPITRKVLEAQIGADKMICSLDILSEAVRQEQCKVAEVVHFAQSSKKRTGLIPQDKYDFFINPI